MVAIMIADLLNLLLVDPEHHRRACGNDRFPAYPLVAVLNPGDGPDENLFAVTGIVWDHDLGVLRLELEHK